MKYLNIEEVLKTLVLLNSQMTVLHEQSEYEQKNIEMNQNTHIRVEEDFLQHLFAYYSKEFEDIVYLKLKASDFMDEKCRYFFELFKEHQNVLDILYFSDIHHRDDDKQDELISFAFKMKEKKFRPDLTIVEKREGLKGCVKRILERNWIRKRKLLSDLIKNEPFDEKEIQELVFIYNRICQKGPSTFNE